MGWIRILQPASRSGRSRSGSPARASTTSSRTSSSTGGISSAVFDVAAGGLGLPGVLVGGALGAAIGARRNGVAPLVMLDVMAPALVAAQAIGRWGNYFNQELFGGPTSLPWGIRIDAAHRPVGYETFTTFHPAFLYESLWDACVLLGLLWLIPRVLGRVRAGRPAGAARCRHRQARATRHHPVLRPNPPSRGHLA